MSEFRQEYFFLLILANIWAVSPVKNSGWIAAAFFALALWARVMAHYDEKAQK